MLFDFGSQYCLPRGMVRSVGGKCDLTVSDVRARLEQRRDVEGERRVAALMAAGQLSIDPHHRPVIHSAEMQQHAPAFPLFRNATARRYQVQG